MNTLATVEQLRESPYVNERELRNGVSAFNFSRKAFWDNHWTAVTVRARGLFIDTNTNKIKARSFDKFFNVGERKETELSLLAENFEYPVYVYEKFNGYLGMCSGELIDPNGSVEDESNFRIWCASKSTDESWYAARFEDLLRDSIGCSLGKFARDLWDMGCTAVFEVIDPINDPHIIDYDKPQVILLALVINDDIDMDFFCKTDEVIDFYNATWKLPWHRHVKELWNANELYEWYDEVTAPDYQFEGRNIEGFVLRDLDDHMVKVKTHFYRFWKAIRQKIVGWSKGEKRKTASVLCGDPLYKRMKNWAKEYCRNYYLMNNEYVQVIKLRNDWEEIDAELNI